MREVRHWNSVDQRYGRCLIPGDFQGEAGSGPGQPDLAVLFLCIAGELDLTSEIPSNTKDSIRCQKQKLVVCQWRLNFPTNMLLNVVGTDGNREAVLQNNV